MQKITFYILYDLSVLTVFITLYYSFKIIKNKSVPNYMKGFYWYPIVSLIVMIPHFGATHFLVFIPFTIVLNNLSLLFHFSFLSFFVFRAVGNKKHHLAQTTVFLFFLLLLIYFIFSELLKQGNPAFSISCLGLTIFCVYYYYELFRKPPILNLRKEAAFWIVTGIFFSMSFETPILAAISYLEKRISYFYFMVFIELTIVCQITMYLFFIKALKCIIQEKKI